MNNDLWAQLEAAVEAEDKEPINWKRWQEFMRREAFLVPYYRARAVALHTQAKALSDSTKGLSLYEAIKWLYGPQAYGHFIDSRDGYAQPPYRDLAWAQKNTSLGWWPPPEEST